MSSLASRDDNRVTTLMGINNVTGLPQEVLVDADGRILVSAIVAASSGVTGPVTSTVGALALWGDATGDSVTDSTVKLVTGVLSPVTSDGVALGSGTLMWADLFLASGSVINWNNGDLTLTHSANTLTLAGGDLNIGAGILTAHSVKADATDGVLIESANGTDVAIFGSANTTNVTFYGAINVTGALSPVVDNTPALGASGQAWADLFLGDGAVINFNAGDVTLTHSANLLTLAGGDLNLGSNNLSILGSIGSTGARSTKGWFTNLEVTNAPTVSGAAVYYSGGTDVALADGGTGASLTDPNADRILFWDDSAGAMTWLTVGTGLSITDTTISASAGSTPRRNLNVQINTTSAQSSGDTNPTDSTATNGVSCSTNVSGGNSVLKINAQTAATWDFYDKDPEFNFSMNYSAGSATGTGIVWFGDTADQLPPTHTQVNKGMFVAAVTTAGSTTWYSVNADGTTNTNTSLAGITSAQQNQWRVVMDSGVNIKFYCNYTLVATHTTNLPSGDWAATSWLEMGVDNGAADTTTRTCSFGYVDVLLDSPTG